MKELSRNPILYYVLIPVIVVLWPMLILTVYLPDAKRNWSSEKEHYNKAQKIIADILTLDPGRLEYADSKISIAEFDYASAVEKTASLCKISSTDYKLSSGRIITSGGQKSQSAMVVLTQVDITKFAKFLSTFQLRWANLECVKIKLTQKKGLVDVWKADLDFKYYY